MCWNFSADGDFNLSSVCLLAAGYSNTVMMNPEGEWKWMWRLNIPPKLKFFIWQCLHEMLPSRVLLNKRGTSLPQECPLCLSFPETTEHLLGHCSVSKRWWESLNSEGSSRSLDSLSWKSWLKWNASTRHYHGSHCIPMFLIFCFCLWEIWLYRNFIVFNKGTCNRNFTNLSFCKAGEFFALAGSLKQVPVPNTCCSLEPTLCGLA